MTRSQNEQGDTWDAARAVTALYTEHALGLTRLAFLFLGDRHAAEDVVQDAFCGLYRAWDRLPAHDDVLGYVRVSVLNGCRSALRRARRAPRPSAVPHADSAEAAALVGEERRAAVAAVRSLPPRQREAVVLRYFAGLTEHETAQAMRVSLGTVKSTTARALAALGRSVLGRSIQIRATATGNLVAAVNPPGLYNDFVVLTGTPDGRTFVFGAERYWGFRGATSPLTGALDPAAPLRFVLLRITADGRARWSALSVPFTILPGQQPSIALSPDGTMLAVAYGGGGQAAILRVVTLATGQVRQWQWPQVPWTPLIQGLGAWTASGRTLVVQQWDVIRGAASQPPATGTPDGTTSFWLVDTGGPSGATTPGKLLTLRAPAGESAPGAAFITPDGSELVTAGVAGGQSLLHGAKQSGEFAEYSTRTGALLRTLAPWTWSESRPLRGNPFLAPEVVWSDPSGSQLLVLQPRDDVNRLGVVTGGSVVLSGSDLLPSQPEAYAELQDALQGATAVPPHMTW